MATWTYNIIPPATQNGPMTLFNCALFADGNFQENMEFAIDPTTLPDTTLNSIKTALDTLVNTQVHLRPSLEQIGSDEPISSPSMDDIIEAQKEAASASETITTLTNQINSSLS